jgi:hypothetical protein
MASAIHNSRFTIHDLARRGGMTDRRPDCVYDVVVLNVLATLALKTP